MNLRSIFILMLFSVAMAALESAVVVYLRALYYPEGFTVAFKLIDNRILMVELGRELATLVMLVSVAWLGGTTVRERFAFFLLAFGVWDIFYYIWLKIFIDWPSSLLEWDILFLIPWTWLGPVLAPVLCSFTMIAFAYVLLRPDSKALSGTTWTILASGVLLILYAFIRDYGHLIISNGFLSDYATIMTNPDFLKLASSFTPDHFEWTYFLAGEACLAWAIFRTR